MRKKQLMLKKLHRKYLVFNEAAFRKQLFSLKLKQQFLDNVTTLIYSNDQINLCKKELSKAY